MPIRVDMLAEAKAAEDLRRRDPFKPTLAFGALLVLAMLSWSLVLQIKTIRAEHRLARLNQNLASKKGEFKDAQVVLQEAGQLQQSIDSLEQLSSQRFRHANLLNALQNVYAEDVRLTELRIDQTYSIIEETRPKTNAANRIIPGRPAQTVEKVSFTLSANDFSVNPGDQINNYKLALAGLPYFRDTLEPNGIILKNMSQRQLLPVPGSGARDCVQFVLECRLPDKMR
jgi:Tfp pilus assembly protein PilN